MQGVRCSARRVAVFALALSSLGIAACLLRRPGAPWRLPVNVAVGMTGALFGGLLMAPVVGMSAGNLTGFNAGAPFVSGLWASILLALMNLFRTRSARP